VGERACGQILEIFAHSAAAPRRERWWCAARLTRSRLAQKLVSDLDKGQARK